MTNIKKSIHELNLEDDFLFAKVMSDKDICKRVLEQILNIKIKEIKYLNDQQAIDIMLDAKAIRLDIYVKDEEETVYNVEIQKTNQGNLPKRSRYYQGVIDMDCIQKGSKYQQLNKTFIIFICTFDPFGQGRHLYTFENRCLEDFSLSLDDQTTKIFLNTEGTQSDVDDAMQEFLTYITNTTNHFAIHSRSELVKVLNQKVDEIKNNKLLEVEYMTLYERLEEVKLETKLKNAKALLKLLDDESIAESIELPLEVVKQLREEYLKENQC